MFAEVHLDRDALESGDYWHVSLVIAQYSPKAKCRTAQDAGPRGEVTRGQSAGGILQ